MRKIISNFEMLKIIAFSLAFAICWFRLILNML